MQQESHDISENANDSQMQYQSDQQDSNQQQIFEQIGSDDQDLSSGEEIQKEQIKIDEINKSAVPANIAQYVSKYEQLDPIKYFKIPKSKQVPKSVCAKVIKYQDTIVECLDCAMDSSCIICMDCFKNGNHQGHKYVAKKAGGGCCDCGDKQAWKQSGFCKNHSGQFLQFEIESKKLEEFYRITDGLLYYYLQKVIKKSVDASIFAKNVMKFIDTLNKQDLYYNKMTSLALKRILPPHYSLNALMNGRTILENILTYAVSGNLIHSWWNTFMGLFPYYPFKMDNFSLIMDGSKQAKNCATSITCQLLTSYKLVQQYTHNNTKPIAYKVKLPKNTSSLWDFTIILLHDLKLLAKLSQNVPLAYWRMHINYGVQNIFEYQEIILKKAAKDVDNMPHTALLAKYIHFCQIQFTLLECFANVLDIVHIQPPLLYKLINFLYNKCRNSSENRNLLPTLRPYERCFTLAVFVYLQCDLDNINPERINYFLKQVLPQVSKVQFIATCARILKDVQSTYFLYSKCMAETGYAQSLYGFAYFYTNKCPFIAYADILCLRMMSLFINEPIFVSIADAILLQKFDTLPKNNQQLYNQQLNKKRVFFQSVLTQIVYLINSKAPQIYLTYAIKGGKCNQYQQQIQEYMLRFFIQKKGIVSQDDFKAFKNGIFNANNQYVDQWIKKHVQLSKAKKQLQLKQKISNIHKKGISIVDFWVNVHHPQVFEDPEKTLEIFGLSTKKITRLIFSQLTVLSIIEVFTRLFQSDNCAKFSTERILQKIFLFFYILKQLQVPSAKLLKEKIVLPNKNILTEQLALVYGIMGLSPKKSEEAQKEKLQAMKIRKLQKFKKKQQDFMLKREKIQVPEETQQKEGNQHEILCCICKNQNPSNLVYLVRVQIRDHQKLLELGPGLQCYSFSTCQHLFDYDCINKNFNSNKTVQSVTCPLCKASANVLIPFSIKQQNQVKQFINRITQITFSLKQAGNLYQQLIKSFYHYTIIASVNPLFCVQRRSKVYKILLQILMLQIPKSEIESLSESFKNNKFGRNFDHPLQNKNKPQSSSIQHLFQQILNQNYEEEQFQLVFPQIRKNKGKGKNQKKKEIQDSGAPPQSSWLFIATINKIINELSNNSSGQNMDTQYPQYFKLAMDALTSQNILQKLPSDYNSQSSDHNAHKIFIELPKKYTEVGMLRNCSQCKQISSELILCLQCGWTGCQNCDNGYSYEHISLKHGQVGAFMFIKNGLGYYSVGNRTVTTGYLYQNYWGHAIKLAKDWNQFELNESIYRQMEKCLKLDEMPSKSKVKN